MSGENLGQAFLRAPERARPRAQQLPIVLSGGDVDGICLMVREPDSVRIVPRPHIEPMLAVEISKVILLFQESCERHLAPVVGQQDDLGPVSVRFLSDALIGHLARPETLQRLDG